MNRNELEAAAEGRLFDAMLDEVVQERVATRGTRERGRSRWLVAALMLLGLGVVVGVVVTSRSGAAVAVTPQEPVQEPLPPVVKVRGIGELQALNRGATNIWYLLRKPEELAALARFQQLRSISIEPDPDLSHEERIAAAWSLSALAECASLEHVTIGYFRNLGVAEFTVLTRLPKLRSLTLLGRDKVVDAELGALLGKLSLRSLVLHAVDVQPEGMRAIGELPLLERLELRDCTGLEKCDLTHLYRLRQLRALALRGVQPSTWWWRRLPGHDASQPSILTPYPLQPPLAPTEGEWAAKAVRGGWTLPAAWMRGLAKALPDLSELDLTESMIDDEVLLALPRKLRRLSIGSALGYGELGVAAVLDLPELRALACGDPSPSVFRFDEQVPAAIWWPTLHLKKLQRLEFTGFPTPEFMDALSQQVELRELRLKHVSRGSFALGDAPLEATVLIEDPLPSFAFLADLPKLTKVELVRPSQSLEAAIRKALPEVLASHVRIEILPH